MSLNPYSPPNPLPEDDPPLVAQLAVEGEGMTVEYEQTFDDLVTLHDSHLRQQPFYRRHRLAIIAVVAGGCGWLLLRPAGMVPQPDQLAGWLFFVAGIV